MKKSEIFLREHKLRAIDINMQELVDVFTSDMIKGLDGRGQYPAYDTNLY